MRRRRIKSVSYTHLDVYKRQGFHRTSPWGGALHNYSTYWDMQDIEVSLNLRSHFMGEFGMASAPNHRSVMRYLPKEEAEQWPPSRFGSFGHHTPRFNQLEPDDMAHLSKRVPEFCAGDTMESFISVSYTHLGNTDGPGNGGPPYIGSLPVQVA